VGGGGLLKLTAGLAKVQEQLYRLCWQAHEAAEEQ
jgi:hypothetical protein